ncbi:MAG: ubiquinol-cytochrome c reductase iron-sulfur subunit [Thermosynechococcaceae cyanobacterium]
MDRRDFLGWVGVGCLASSLPVAIAACSTSSEQSATPGTSETAVAASPNADGFIAVGSLKALDQAGFIQDKNFSAGPLLVIRDPANTTKLIAVNSTCTHKGCAVDWKTGENTFVCPCHNSKFKPDGGVAQGPAEQPLTKFVVKAEGDSILVKAA